MSFEEIISKLKPRFRMVLELDGRPVVDERLASLLKMVEETGSILSASKALGLAYSRAWEAIFKAEGALGAQLVERRPGRVERSARLTEEGREVLQLYLRYTSISLPEAERHIPEFIYAGSHDPLLSSLLGHLKAEKEVHWVGSLVGLMSLSVGDADISGVHLFDPSTDSYNVPYVERLGLKGFVRLFPGYEREIGVAYRPGVKATGLDGLFDENIKWVNRNPGSGTRILFEGLIEERSRALGISPAELRERIRGYTTCVNTHQEVAEAITSGKADAGITIRAVAEMYGLKFIHLKWESFDFAVAESSLGKPVVREFLELLKNIDEIMKRFPGYRPSQTTSPMSSEGL